MKLDPDSLHRRIQLAYDASSNGLGWRLLSSRAETLKAAPVAFLGLNPGGMAPDASHDGLAPSASSYIHEHWGGHTAGSSPLQRQVRRLYQRLNVDAEDVLSGNLVPFRSSSWSGLRDAEMALSFGRCLWNDILMQAKPRVIVTMGMVCYLEIRKILQVSEVMCVPLAWGNICGRRSEGGGVVVVGLPHLSRFGVMTRAASEPALDHLFRGTKLP